MLHTWIQSFDTCRAEFHPVRLRLLSGFPFTIYNIIQCWQEGMVVVGGIFLPTNSNSGHHSPLVSSGFDASEAPSVPSYSFQSDWTP